MKSRVPACAVVLVSILAPFPWAQLVPAGAARTGERTDLPVESRIHRFARSLEASGARGAAAAAAARVAGLDARDDGTLKLEVVGRPGGPPVGEGVVASAGGAMHAVWRERAAVWIPAERVLDLARALPAGYHVESSFLPDGGDGSANAGELHTGADTYVAGGDAGQGIRVAIIDGGFAKLSAAQASGLAPSIEPFHAFDLTGTGLEAGSNNHGTLCVQTVFHQAPAAEYWVFKVSNLTELGIACGDIAAFGIEVTSMSISYSTSTTGWEDDSGSACAAVQDICDAGGLVFNSSGNRAQTHWQGTYTAGAGSASFHDWALADELLAILVKPGETLWVGLSWDNSGGGTDYDLALWNNTPTGLAKIEESTNSGTDFESLSWTNGKTTNQTRYLSIQKVSGPDTELEISCTPDVGGKIVLEHVVAASSVKSPGNCTDPRVITIGAVDWDLYASKPGTAGIVAAYSSQGPTNGGALAPDLVAPTGTEVGVGGSFIGTSCSAPNAAGAAATLWSSAPYLNAIGLRLVLLRKAALVKDWGLAAADDVYGHGGLWLYPWHQDTVFVDATVLNPFFNPARPFPAVAPAQAFATPGGRLLFLAGSYPPAVKLDKELRVDTVVPTAVLGD